MEASEYRDHLDLMIKSTIGKSNAAGHSSGGNHEIIKFQHEPF
jgi:hypothetical protein